MQRVLVAALWMTACLSMHSQTVLIDPAAGGGFENGTTFSANGWTVENGSATNQWFLGTIPTQFPSRSAYISNNGGISNAYTNTASSVVHFWRDVTFPAGETSIVLSFDWNVVGEFGFWDGVMVSLAPTSYIPTASTTSIGTGVLAAPAVNVASVWSTGTNPGVQTLTVSIPASITNNCAGPSTMRLLFTWKNDGSGGISPVVIDNISLTSATPAIPLSGGSYTIDNTMPTGGSNFASFTAAISALNGATGCGSLTGPLVFNVSAGQTFNETPPAITASGTAINTITFQKSGGGNNPVITPTGGSGTADAGITISGGDFITFDGIDVNSSAVTTVEYGYLIRNASALNGAKNNTIKNTTITLSRSNLTSRGVLQTAAFTGGGFSATNATGTNDNNQYLNFSIRNAYGGVFLLGTSTTFPDLNNVIGTTACGTFNSIGDPNVPNDIGNQTTTATYGINATNQNGVAIRSNRISNVSTSAGQVDGINVVAFAGTTEVSNNIINTIRQVSTTSTALASGIRMTHFATGSHTMRLFNNAVGNVSSSYTTNSATRLARGIFLVSTTGTTTYDIYHNTVVMGGAAITHSNAAFETATTSTAATLNIRNNIFSNTTSHNNATARHFSFVHTSSATVLGAAGTVASHNNLHIANDAGVTGFAVLGAATTYVNSAGWQAAVAQASANIDGDPLMLGFVPQSAIVDATGFTPAPAYITTDLGCNPRGNDIGAYEFTVPTCFFPSGTVNYVEDCASNSTFWR